MNLVTTLVNTLEGLLKPENLSNKADQVRGGGAAPCCCCCSSQYYSTGQACCMHSIIAGTG